MLQRSNGRRAVSCWPSAGSNAWNLGFWSQHAIRFRHVGELVELVSYESTLTAGLFISCTLRTHPKRPDMSHYRQLEFHASFHDFRTILGASNNDSGRFLGSRMILRRSREVQGRLRNYVMALSFLSNDFLSKTRICLVELTGMDWRLWPSFCTCRLD